MVFHCPVRAKEVENRRQGNGQRPQAAGVHEHEKRSIFADKVIVSYCITLQQIVCTYVVLNETHCLGVFRVHLCVTLLCTPIGGNFAFAGAMAPPANAAIPRANLPERTVKSIEVELSAGTYETPGSKAAHPSSRWYRAI